MATDDRGTGPYHLSGRVAIVTGAGRGLGRHMALALARAGASVALAARTIPQLERVRAEIEAAGGTAIAVPTDVGVSSQVTTLIETTIERFGRLDVLVNNAGGSASNPESPFETRAITEIGDEEWRYALEVNLSSALYGARAALPHLLKQGGTIINMSSGEGLLGGPHWGVAVAHGGVMTLTRVLSQIYAKQGVRTNCLVPGFIASHVEEGDSAQLEQFDTAMSRFNPTGRAGRGWELEPLVLFLASDASSYVTGQMFVIDGGGVAGGFAPTGFAPEVGA